MWMTLTYLIHKETEFHAGIMNYKSEIEMKKKGG